MGSPLFSHWDFLITGYHLLVTTEGRARGQHHLGLPCSGIMTRRTHLCRRLRLGHSVTAAAWPTCPSFPPKRNPSERLPCGECVMCEKGPVSAEVRAETQSMDCQPPRPVPNAWFPALPGLPSTLSPPEQTSVLSAVSCTHSIPSFCRM